MFSGEFEYRIDEKGRLPFPPRYRPLFREGVVVAPGVERCLTIYTPAEWKKLSDSLNSSSLPPSKLRRINRAIFATAFAQSLDAQGRITLPASLRQYAGLSQDVVIAGANNYLELWDMDAWDAEKSASLSEAWQIMESLEKH